MFAFLATFLSYSFINSHLLRIGTILAGVDMVMGEPFTIWILWIFFLITSALVTVCSRTFFAQCRSYILLQEQFSNLIISNGAKVITKSAGFWRLSKHSVGFAGAFYPFFLSLRLSSSCWATVGVEIGAVNPNLTKLPKHAKLALPQP